MSDPRAYISFDFDHDEKHRNLFAGQAKTDSPTPFAVADWSSKAGLNEQEWERITKDKIGRCNMLIVLVGRYMATATGVKKETTMADTQDVPVFGVYVDGANTESTLPVGLPRNRVVAWKWSTIAASIDQMMTEKKNRK